MSFNGHVLLRFRPWSLNTDEDIEVAEDFMSFGVDLCVYLEEYDGVAVVVIGILVRFEEPVRFGIEDETVDIFSDFGWECEE